MWGWAKKHVYVLRVGYVWHVSGGWVDDMVRLSGAGGGWGCGAHDVLVWCTWMRATHCTGDVGLAAVCKCGVRVGGGEAMWVGGRGGGWVRAGYGRGRLLWAVGGACMGMDVGMHVGMGERSMCMY